LRGRVFSNAITPQKLHSSTALPGLSWASAARAAAERTPPDLIVINAKIATMDPTRQSA